MTTATELAARRQAIGDAALSILSSHGVTELSVRRVAATANIAPSSLRYLFPTQRDLRAHATHLLVSRLEDRVNAHGVTENAADGWSILCELLPLDAERTREMEASLALGSAAHNDPELQNDYRRVHEAVRHVCATAITTRDHAPADPNEVTLLHALVDGIALHLIRPFSGLNPEQAIAALRADFFPTTHETQKR